MDIPMVEMDRDEALERLTAYRTALRRGADAEYVAAVAGYEALAAGTPVVQVSDVIRQAPQDELGRPLIAVARADREQVQFVWGWRSDRCFFDCTVNFRQAVTMDSLLISAVNMGRNNGDRSVQGFALVPMAPPHARAAAGGRSKLKDHLVMWEVEEWADKPLHAVPDRDPLLLRRIHGDLFAVVAAWDLTELERAIMAGRSGL